MVHILGSAQPGTLIQLLHLHLGLSHIPRLRQALDLIERAPG
jgi:hypothetical protein